MIEIYTIGHGNRKIEDLILLLQRNRIEIVIDVRSVPYSRYHPQFRQVNLKDSLKSAGIDYLWLGNELGGRPSDPNMYTNGMVDYAIMKETSIFKAGIEKVLQLATQNIKVTLICSESDPNQCHRKILISNSLVTQGVCILHINKFGKLEPDQI